MGKSGRHKKGKQGHTGKRRHSTGGGWAGGRPPRQQATFEASDSDSGVLHIGGVVVRVDSAGGGTASLQPGGVSNRHRRQRRRGSTGSLPGPARAHQLAMQPRLGASGSGSSSNGSSGGGSSSSRELDERDAAVQDYLANLVAAEAAEAEAAEKEGGGDGARASGSSGSQADSEGDRRAGSGPGSAAKRRRRAYEEVQVLRRFSQFDMEDEGPVTGLGWPGLSSDEDDGSTSDSDTSSSSSDSDSDGSDSDDESSSSSEGEKGWSGSEGEGKEGTELMEEDMQHLSLAQRYPVQVRPRPPPLPGQQQTGKQAGGKKKKGKPGVKGAKGGKLAPGEKKRLKHERMEAKRAARAAARGFDVAWVNTQLEEFVARQGDMQTFGPFGKHECRAVQRLAALYGCRATLQGSKSNRKIVVVSATPRTCLPQGDDLLQIGQLLVAQTAAERSGVAFDGRLSAAMAGADLASVLPASLAARGGAGRWSALRRNSSGAGGSGAPGSSGVKAPKKKRSKLKPVAFVSVGAINPEEAVTVAVSAPAGTAVAAAAAAAAAAQGDVNMAAAAGGGSSSEEVEEWEAGTAPQQQQQQQQQQQGLGPSAAAAAGLQLLAVAEDLSGSDAEPTLLLGPLPQAVRGEAAAAAAAAAKEEQEGDASAEASEEDEAAGGRAGLGSSGTLYNRMTALSLDRAAPGSGLSPRASGGSTRGSAAAEGITNPGRLLGLGLALGIGAEVFGAPGPSEGAAEEGDADLSPLSPLLSKSQLRKLQRRTSRGNGGGGSTPGLRLSEAAAQGAPSGSGRQQDQQPGRDGRPGCSKAERHSRSGAAALAAAMAASSGEDAGEAVQQRFGGLGLGAGVGASIGDGSPEGAVPPEGNRSLVSGDYGDFERHTLGIGSRLLAKWGHRGEGVGLGRAQQGRAEPVQPVRRAKKLGLGAVEGR